MPEELCLAGGTEEVLALSSLKDNKRGIYPSCTLLQALDRLHGGGPYAREVTKTAAPFGGSATHIQSGCDVAFGKGIKPGSTIEGIASRHGFTEAGSSMLYPHDVVKMVDGVFRDQPRINDFRNGDPKAKLSSETCTTIVRKMKHVFRELAKEDSGVQLRQHFEVSAVLVGGGDVPWLERFNQIAESASVDLYGNRGSTPVKKFYVVGAVPRSVLCGFGEAFLAEVEQKRPFAKERPDGQATNEQRSLAAAILTLPGVSLRGGASFMTRHYQLVGDPPLALVPLLPMANAEDQAAVLPSASSRRHQDKVRYRAYCFNTSVVAPLHARSMPS